MSETNEDALSGLDQVRALIAAGRQPAFGVKLGVSLIEVTCSPKLYQS